LGRRNLRHLKVKKGLIDNMEKVKTKTGLGERCKKESASTMGNRYMKAVLA
jgi:hypothetical protein